MYHSPSSDAGWSSLAARRAHNPKVVGSNPAPATNQPISDLSNRQLLDSIEKSLSNLSLRYSARNSIVLVYHLFL